MLLKPSCLSETTLNDEELKADKKNCLKAGPCGLGKKALYLNSFYIDRCYYVPLTSVNRVFKRIAMSKGGFSGRGVFASIPYLVVEYDNGKQKQCTFKDERHVDALLDALRKSCPNIPLVSEEAEKRLAQAEEERRRNEQREVILSKEEQSLIHQLKNARHYLEEKPEFSDELAFAAKRKRSFQTTSPSYRWTAMFITILGTVSILYGIYTFLHHSSFAIYFTLFGFAAIFLFAGYSVLPTARNNKTVLYRHYDEAVSAMQNYVSHKEAFPLPARYAHPLVLKRMENVICQHRAKSVKDALSVVKEDLKALTPDVQVLQEEYDEVVIVKPLFTVADYE